MSESSRPLQLDTPPVPSEERKQQLDLQAVLDAITILKAEAQQLGVIDPLHTCLEQIDRFALAIQGNMKVSMASSIQKLFQLEREHVTAIVSSMHAAESLDKLLKATVIGIGESLRVSRALIYGFEDDWQGKVLMEALVAGWTPAKNANIPLVCFGLERASEYQNGSAIAIADTAQWQSTPHQRQSLEHLQVRASVTLPIFLGTQPWGLLVLHQCDRPRVWQEVELSFAHQITRELAHCLQVFDLQAQLQKLTADLEQEKRAKERFQQVMDDVQSRTDKLMQLSEHMQAQGQSLQAGFQDLPQVATAITTLSTQSQQLQQVLKETTLQPEDDAITLAIGNMLSARKKIADAAQHAKRLNETAQKIGQNMQYAYDLAAQTDLLGLNIGLEATRSGDRGQGFVAIAEEVRELSRQSAAAIAEIVALIADIQAETVAIVMAMEAGSTHALEGTKAVNVTSDCLQAIAESFAEIRPLVAEMGQFESLQQQATTAIATLQETAITIEQTSQEVRTVSATLIELLALETK